MNTENVPENILPNYINRTRSSSLKQQRRPLAAVAKNPARTKPTAKKDNEAKLEAKLRTQAASYERLLEQGKTDIERTLLASNPRRIRKIQQLSYHLVTSLSFLYKE